MQRKALHVNRGATISGGPRASERRQMTASASRQVEDRRLLNETTSGKEGSCPRRAGEAHRLTFTWDSIHESRSFERAKSVRGKKKKKSYARRPKTTTTKP